MGARGAPSGSPDSPLRTRAPHFLIFLDLQVPPVGICSGAPRVRIPEQWVQFYSLRIPHLQGRGPSQATPRTHTTHTGM